MKCFADGVWGMLVHLENIDKNQILERHMDVAKLEVETVSGIIVVKNLTAEFKFRVDPQGFLMSYDISSVCEIPCTRCGQELEMPFKCSDLAALRKNQPEDQHLVLDRSEMNVFFLKDQAIDLMRVLEELIELELPAYPRHEAGEPQCVIPNQEEEEAEKQSPFGSLAKFLDD